MSDTNNRPPIQRGLMDVREGGGALPDRGNSVGWNAGTNADTSLDATNSLGGFNAGSDPASPSKDMPNMADKFGGRTSSITPAERMGSMSGTGSDDAMDVTPGDEGMPGDRD